MQYLVPALMEATADLVIESCFDLTIFVAYFAGTLLALMSVQFLFIQAITSTSISLSTGTTVEKILPLVVFEC